MSDTDIEKSNKKVALVTGASSGIGEATALKYAELGYQVAITGRNEERLAKVVSEMAKVSSRPENDFLSIQADFQCVAQVEVILPKTVEKFGQLDILINNAAFGGEGRGIEEPEFFKDFQNIMQVNLMAATRLAQLAVPHLIKTNGVIINVSSVADRIPTPTISYSVSKAGLSMLTKTLANALDGKNVRVITVSPGPVKTRFSRNTQSMTSVSLVGRVAESYEIAETIVFLTSEKAGFIHGCTIDIDGGTCAKYGGFFQNLKRQNKS